MKSPQKPKSVIVTDNSDLATESSSEDEYHFVPAMTAGSAATSTRDNAVLQEVETEQQDTTEEVGDAQPDIHEISDDYEIGSAFGINESEDHDSDDTLDNLVLTPIPPHRRSLHARR